jgi:hypothetical protein
MRNGDFSGLINGAGILQVIYDPNTTQPATSQRTPFPNNQIPITRISPLAKTMYAATPFHTADNPADQLQHYRRKSHYPDGPPNFTYASGSRPRFEQPYVLPLYRHRAAAGSARNSPVSLPANVEGRRTAGRCDGLPGDPHPDHQRRPGTLTYFPDILLRDHFEPAMAGDVCPGKRGFPGN